MSKVKARVTIDQEKARISILPLTDHEDQRLPLKKHMIHLAIQSMQLMAELLWKEEVSRDSDQALPERMPVDVEVSVEDEHVTYQVGPLYLIEDSGTDKLVIRGEALHLQRLYQLFVSRELTIDYLSDIVRFEYLRLTQNQVDVDYKAVHSAVVEKHRASLAQLFVTETLNPTSIDVIPTEDIDSGLQTALVKQDAFEPRGEKPNRSISVRKHVHKKIAVSLPQQAVRAEVVVARQLKGSEAPIKKVPLKKASEMSFSSQSAVAVSNTSTDRKVLAPTVSIFAQVKRQGFVSVQDKMKSPEKNRSRFSDRKDIKKKNDTATNSSSDSESDDGADADSGEPTHATSSRATSGASGWDGQDSIKAPYEKGSGLFSDLEERCNGQTSTFLAGPVELAY